MGNRFLNDWKIVDKIGDGHFGTVYKAVKSDGSVFAIKHISLPRSKEELDRLIKKGIVDNYKDANDYFIKIITNEIEVMKKFNGNPNIVDCYETYQENKPDGSGIDFYIRMEYVEDIKTYYTNRLIDVDEVVKLGIDICTALELCASINIIHNDIKPTNIFIGSDNKYKLGDFNAISKYDSNNLNSLGTMNYLAPEVYNGKNVTSSTDLYSLGLVMYKLINGDLPYVSKISNEEAAFEIRMSGKSIPIIRGLNKKLMDILFKACSFEESKRYKNATEMKKDLEKLSHINSKKRSVVFSSNKNFNETIDIDDPSLLSATSGLVGKNKLVMIDKYKIKAVIVSIVFLGLISVLGGTYALNRSCDAGYVNKNGFCVKGYYYCDPGYSLNADNKCQKTVDSVEAKVTYTCPSGYALNGDMCVSTDIEEPTFEYVCADGFTLNEADKKCERTESADAIQTYGPCDDGYILAGDLCLSGNANPIYGCSDSSYTYNSSNNTCTKTVSKTVAATKEYTCESGATLNGAVCEYRDVTYWNCWKYGTYQGGVCKANAKLSYTCPSNGTLDSNMNCVIKTVDTKNATVVNYDTNVTSYKAPTKYTCTDSTKLINGKCYGTVTTDAVGMYTCPDGFVASGVTCIQENFPTPVKKYTCSRVYTLNGGQCEKYEIVQAKKYYYDSD